MLEEQEENIEQWYFNKQLRNATPLEKYICEDRVLKNHDASCLAEVYTPSVDAETNKRAKGDTGEKDL